MPHEQMLNSHADRQDTAALIAAAARRCERQQRRLTPQRTDVLALLLNAGGAMTAYELLDAYREQYQRRAPPMTIYRALDFLLAAGAIHRLDSSNQFLVCQHLGCQHEHETAQFLICDACHGVEEVAVDPAILAQFESQAQQKGFEIRQLQFETHGYCRNCRQRPPAAPE